MQRFFNDVPTEVFINPPASMARYFEEEGRAGRPLTAHMLATGFKVLDLDPIVERLRSEAGRRIAYPPGFPDLEMMKYAIATAYEDAVDVAPRDDATALMILDEAIGQALSYGFLRNGRHIPRQKDIIGEITATDSELGALVRRFFSAAPLSERLTVGSEIVDRVSGERAFFEWETEAEPVEDGALQEPAGPLESEAD